MNKKLLNILILEDNPDDAELVAAELKKKGCIINWNRVDTKEDFKKSLKESPDLILADYKLPSLNALDALKIKQEIAPAIPLIIVSGTIGEEFAVECIKAGANDYVLKDRLFCLCPVIERALKEAKEHKEHKQAEQAFLKSDIRYKNLYSMMRLMCDNLPDLIWTKDMEGKFLFVNKACSEILLDARDTDEPIGKTDIYFADRIIKSHPEIPGYLSLGKKCVGSDLTVIESNKPMRFDESGNIKGKFLSLDVYKAPFYNENGNIIGTVGSARVVTRERQMEQELQQSYQKLKKSLESSIEIMSKIVEVKDPYTAGHQQRVSLLTTAIAKELNLSPDKIEGTRIASLIHDIGKISVPTEILSKSIRLSDIEFSLIKEHSQIGYDILKAIDFSYPVANIVLQHHEKINGSGYPGGLKGDEILLEAKIICVADVVEAMSSHRPYRPALGINAALEEISKNKGILYDPKVVDACLKLFKEKEFKF